MLLLARGSKTLFGACVPMDAYLNVALSCERTQEQGGLESWLSTANSNGDCTVIECPSATPGRRMSVSPGSITAQGCPSGYEQRSSIWNA